MGWLAAGARRLFREALEAGSGSWWTSLHTGSPGTTGADEQAGAAYERVEIAAGAGWNIAAAAVGNELIVSNAARLTFPTPTATYAAAITHAALWDSETAGTLYATLPLTTPVTPQREVGLYFLPGDLELYIATDD